MESLKNFFTTHRKIIIRVGIALAIFLAVIVAFGLLADEVHEGGTLRIDQNILLWIHIYATPMLDSFFVNITDIGSVAFIGIITLIIGVYLISKRLYVKTFMLLAAMGGAAVLNITLKLLFERARPELWDGLIQESNFSFPSGHAMASSALTFTIIALLWNTKWRFTAIIIGALYMSVIGLSRLYLGVHYPTDIIGGWLVSFAWVLAVSVIVYTHSYKRRHTEKLSENK